MEERIAEAVSDHIAVITINRPKVLNALDVPTLLELETVFDRLERNDDVRVIIITGAGERAFVAGGDIADLNSRRRLGALSRIRRDRASRLPPHRDFRQADHRGGERLCARRRHRTYSRNRHSDSRRHGALRIAGNHARAVSGAGGTQRIIRQVPLCRAKEIMFTGEQISAAEAVAIGLANKVVPAQSVLVEARNIASKIAAKSPLVLSLLKRTLTNGADMPLSAALPYEQSMIGLVFDTSDAHEGCSAFLEKRKAAFTGR